MKQKKTVVPKGCLQLIGYYSLFKKKWIDGITIYLTLAVTLFIFPVLLLKIESTSENENWKKYFKDFTAFFSFALGDFISRYTYLVFRWPKPGTFWMIIVAISRILFLFLFFLCSRGGNTVFPAIFTNDIIPIFFVFLFGLTNGHLITTVFSVPYSYEFINFTLDLKIENSKLTAQRYLCFYLDAD
ncbi:hypothetical protein MXB_4688 [Myxobolus squamalis]|nr:hypothetical protein MXB_4688 [Myxobolus squamalis]